MWEADVKKMGKRKRDSRKVKVSCILRGESGCRSLVCKHNRGVLWGREMLEFESRSQWCVLFLWSPLGTLCYKKLFVIPALGLVFLHWLFTSVLTDPFLQNTGCCNSSEKGKGMCIYRWSVYFLCLFERIPKIMTVYKQLFQIQSTIGQTKS